MKLLNLIIDRELLENLFNYKYINKLHLYALAFISVNKNVIEAVMWEN